MKDWLWLALAVLALFILAPRLAVAGARGLVSGDWRPWNERILQIIEG